MWLEGNMYNENRLQLSTDLYGTSYKTGGGGQTTIHSEKLKRFLSAEPEMSTLYTVTWPEIRELFITDRMEGQTLSKTSFRTRRGRGSSGYEETVVDQRQLLLLIRLIRELNVLRRTCGWCLCFVTRSAKYFALVDLMEKCFKISSDTWSLSFFIYLKVAVWQEELKWGFQSGRTGYHQIIDKL